METSDYETREKSIISYFNDGYSYKEIIVLLAELHNITLLSIRQLKRILRSLGLSRRKSNCSFIELYETMENLMNTSDSLLGYRKMHQKLNFTNNIRVSRTIVSSLQRLIDPDGVARRRANRLKRRKYYAKGPNSIWHIDGYDKLKRFGFCIHGCIDGYSRKVLWLQTSNSNNSPTIIASYYLKYTQKIGGTAKLIRSDGGTENYNVAAIQRFFRMESDDNLAGMKSFLFGKSTSNQRIEAFWSQLRRSFTQWWMNEFKDMADTGSWDETDPLHRECLKFCFSKLIQDELDQVTRLHNAHNIRPTANAESPGGKPNILYHAPSCSGTSDQKIRVQDNDFDIAKSLIEEPPDFGCSDEFAILGQTFMAENDRTFPKSFQEGKQLYFDILNFIDDVETVQS